MARLPCRAGLGPDLQDRGRQADTGRDRHTLRPLRQVGDAADADRGDVGRPCLTTVRPRVCPPCPPISAASDVSARGSRPPYTRGIAGRAPFLYPAYNPAPTRLPPASRIAGPPVIPGKGPSRRRPRSGCRPAGPGRGSSSRAWSCRSLASALQGEPAEDAVGDLQVAALLPDRPRVPCPPCSVVDRDAESWQVPFEDLRGDRRRGGSSLDRREFQTGEDGVRERQLVVLLFSPTTGLDRRFGALRRSRSLPPACPSASAGSSSGSPFGSPFSSGGVGIAVGRISAAGIPL